MEREKIQQLVFAVIEDVNAQLPDGHQLQQSEDAVLFGKGGQLDSLGLVNFIVAVEQKIEDELDKTLTLADEKAMSMKNSPFRSVGTLIDYVQTRLKAASI